MDKETAIKEITKMEKVTLRNMTCQSSMMPLK